VFGYFARLTTPVDFQSIDGCPVDLVFLMLSPPDAGADHLKALARGQPGASATATSPSCAARARGRALRPALRRRKPRCRLSRAAAGAGRAFPGARIALPRGADQRLFESQIEIAEAGLARIRFEVTRAPSTPPAPPTARSISR
jgi:hypothetical protein